MTNYSELSDQEIAERCAKVMGWIKREPNDQSTGVSGFLKGIFSVEIGSFIFNTIKGSSPQSSLEQIFFDWPAPLMMAKVEEMLLPEWCPVSIPLADGKWRYEITDGEGWPEFIIASSKPRALYGAFLYAMGVKNDR